MNEFIEKLIGRLEEEKAIHTKFYRLSEYREFPEIKTRHELIMHNLNKTIDIINELAEEHKPKTNADKIRNMTNDELAFFLDEVYNHIDNEFAFPCKGCREKINCDICFKDWLERDSEV